MRACMCPCACILEIIEEASYLFTRKGRKKQKRLKKNNNNNNIRTDHGDDAPSKTSRRPMLTQSQDKSERREENVNEKGTKFPLFVITYGTLTRLYLKVQGAAGRFKPILRAKILFQATV